ncbi:MAG TPA: hypothetical protein VNN62_17770 [Methylomirabilota bacterium]|jgi:hypothetical protein|nr:hypothetical protein [Methylomirabilota bacterium]
MRQYAGRLPLGEALFLIICSCSLAYGHGEGGNAPKNVVQVQFVPNPDVPEFAKAGGKAIVSLTEGSIQLAGMTGFPFDVQNNRILPVNITSTTDPRLKGHGGARGATSCHPANTQTRQNEQGGEQEEPIGPWSCHVHSYVVWLAELEDGVLGHPIPLGTIYPRTDGTAADRNFSFREGDVSGFGANVIIITAEVTFGALPTVSQGSDGSISTQLAPQGPVVLQATLP